jgi:pimeloyl-ACP methyl ester carboxylesterase
MLVATTRKAAEDPGELYSGERGTAISLNTLTVSIPPDAGRKIGEVQWPKRVPPDPKKEFAVLKDEKVTSGQQALNWFRKNRNAKRQVIVFVHGFNNTYADAVFRFAQITHDAGTDAAPILFTWPSRASVLGYLYDKESTNYSRRALEDLIIQIARSPDVGDITILAHSMGTWLTAEALRGVAMREKTIPAKIHNVVLASPDIDVEGNERGAPADRRGGDADAGADQGQQRADDGRAPGMLGAANSERGDDREAGYGANFGEVDEARIGALVLRIIHLRNVGGVSVVGHEKSPDFNPILTPSIVPAKGRQRRGTADEPSF